MRKKYIESAYDTFGLNKIKKFKSTSLSRRIVEEQQPQWKVWNSAKDCRKSVKKYRIKKRKIHKKTRWDLLKPGNYVCDCGFRHQKIKKVEISYDYFSKNIPSNVEIILESGFNCDFFHCCGGRLLRSWELDKCPQCKEYNESKAGEE